MVSANPVDIGETRRLVSAVMADGETARVTLVRRRDRERFAFVDNPRRHCRSAFAARDRRQAMNHAARIEETIAGLENPIGLPLGFEHQGPFEYVAEFVSGMSMKADGGAGRQYRRA